MKRYLKKKKVQKNIQHVVEGLKDKKKVQQSLCVVKIRKKPLQNIAKAATEQ